MNTNHLASRRFATVVALTVVPVLAAGCGGGATTAGGGGGGAKASTLRIAVNSQTSGNPAKSEYAVYWGAMGSDPAYAALFHLTPEGKIQANLATKWGYASSAKTKNTVFDFTLRSGAKFSDGTPVTADATVAWLKYFVKAKGIFSNVLGPDPKFTATGPLSVRITLKVPNPSLPLILSDQGSVIGRIGSPKAVADPKLMDSGTYGAGPYMLQASSTVNGDHYTYVPNPYYWDKKAVRFKSIYLKVIANASTRLQAQQSGQYDVTIGDPATAGAAKGAGLTVATAPQGQFYLSLDLKHDVGAPALKDVRVRQAMNYAIDRAGISKALFGGSSVPSYGFITQDNDTTSANFKYGYDPAKAKQLMAEAGYGKGFTLSSIDTGTFFGKYGTPLMNAVAQDLEAIGIKLESKSYPNLSAYATQVFKFKAAIAQSLGVITTTPAAYTQNVDASAPVNFYGKDQQIAQAYQEGVSSADPSTGWNKVWQRYTEQAYTVPLVTYPALYYVSKKIGGVDVSAAHPSALPTEWYPAG